MRRRRLLTILVLLPLLLVLVLLAGGWLWSRGGYPQTNGTLALAGLQQGVEIRRDELGVPHLYASSLRDLAFAQGVVQAQDRLWQMDFQRRIGQGRLSEMFGGATLETDRFLRTIGTNHAALADYEALSAEAKDTLQAYADGVNAYVATGARLPIEYTLLGIPFEPWQPADTLAWAKMMQWDLSNNWEDELLRARLVEQVGMERASLLMGDETPVGSNLPVALGDPDLTALADSLARVGRVVSATSGDRGSNAWVVSGALTESGRPLLANDPHLGPSMPSLWYESGLHAPGIDVVGASLVGAPGIVIGHNGHIAWGVTTLYVDTQDLYIERVDEEAGSYEWKGEALPLEEREEIIHVKGGEDVTLRVRATRHGPLLNEVVEGLDQPVAFQWRAMQQPSRLIEAVLALNVAANRDDFMAALRLWDSPPQNFVYADDTGQIGYVAAGAVPIRDAATGVLPQPGWLGEHEWRGTMPFRDALQIWDPAEGYLVTANDNPYPATTRGYRGDAWASTYRHDRIAQLIEELAPLNAADMMTIQRDSYSLPAAKLVPLLLAVKSDDIVVQRMQEQLKSWNGRVESELPGAGIYEVVQGFIASEMLSDELGEELTTAYMKRSHKQIALMQQLLDEPDHPLWDDTRTPTTERRDDILLRALAEARDWLGRRYGDVPHEWSWGRMHTLTFDHPIGSQAPLDRLFNRVVAVGGDRMTVNANGFTYGDSYEALNIPSYRQVVDVGEWGGSLMLHSTGQSGNPFHPHFADMIGRWQRVELAPMLWSEGQTKAASNGRVLQLVPR